MNAKNHAQSVVCVVRIFYTKYHCLTYEAMIIKIWYIYYC